MCAGIQLYLWTECPGPLPARGIQPVQLVHHVPGQGLSHPQPHQDLHAPRLGAELFLSHSGRYFPENIMQNCKNIRPQGKDRGNCSLSGKVRVCLLTRSLLS